MSSEEKATLDTKGSKTEEPVETVETEQEPPKESVFPEKLEFPDEAEFPEEEVFPEEPEENFEEKIEQAMAKIIMDVTEDGQPAPKVVHAREEVPVIKPVPVPERKVSAPIPGVKPLPYGRPSGKAGKKVRKSAPPKNQQRQPQTYTPPVAKGRPGVPAGGYASQSMPPRPKKKHKGIKVFGIVASMAIVIAGCGYAAMTYYYSDKFFKGTQINGIDCSGLTIAQVEDEIADKVENYSIEVISRDLEPQTIKGTDIGYEYVPDGSVGKALKEQVPFEWVQGFFSSKTVTAETPISYNQEKLESQMNSLECAKPENQEAPENAYVAFKDSQFEIVPETAGRTLDVRQALKLLKKAVSESASSVNFDEENTYVAAAVKKDDPGLAATLESCNAYTKASITYTFGEQTKVLDAQTIKDWLTFDEKGQFIKDDAALSQHVSEYVAQLAAEYNTVGKERNFHTTSGRDIIVSGGNYGWQIDQASEAATLLEEIRTGQVVTREPVYSVTGYTPGPNDIGNTYVEVDLSSQYMWYYKDGVVIFESDFVSGNMSYSDRMTPTGVNHLYYKQRNQTLKGDKKPDGTYEYEQPVDYWMPFDGGVGFHDANWRGSFGGSIYLTNGSHGCINLPPSNAAILYDLIDTSVPIVVFY